MKDEMPENISYEFNQEISNWIVDQHKDSVEVVGGKLRWKADPLIRALVDSRVVDLNKLIFHFEKRDPLYQELYRKIGYTIYGYWEIFYWEMNQPNLTGGYDER